MDDIVVKVEGISKKYHLGSIGQGSLRRDLQSWWARMRSKEDPNSIVCVNQKIGLEKARSESFLALESVSFEIKRGDVVGIIGRNGAGKSTLLKILSRVTTPTKGEVKIKGRVASLLEVGTGFHPELTGRENIYINGAILGMTKAEITRKFDEIVEFSGVSKFIDTPVKRYSSGMYVRLAFGVAAHLDPDILIVDEVLAVGDIEFQKKCIGKMHDLSHQSGRTVLFVSHNMSAISRLCRRGILLNQGNVLLDGGVGEVVSRYLGTKCGEKILSPNGIGGITVQSVLMKSSSGDVTESIATLEDAVFEMHCAADRPFKEVTFAICFNNIHEVRVTSLWTSYKANVFSVREGCFVVLFNVSKVRLIPGDYELTTYIESGGREIERVDSFKRINVKYTDRYGMTVEPTISQGYYVEDFNVKMG